MGYRVYVGTRSGVYSVGSYEVVGRTSFTVPNLLVGTTYIFAVTAFDKPVKKVPSRASSARAFTNGRLEGVTIYNAGHARSPRTIGGQLG